MLIFEKGKHNINITDNTLPIDTVDNYYIKITAATKQNKFCNKVDICELSKDVTVSCEDTHQVKTAQQYC